MLRLRCPICGKQEELDRRSDWPCFPFCGVRCRTIDLGRWLGERYPVPARPTELDELADSEADASATEEQVP